MDLQQDTRFQALNIALINIGIDPLPQLETAARTWHITTPLLSDRDSHVSRTYGVLQWAMPSGEPGHTFVLIGKDGKVVLIQDYGAQQNGGRMYVPVNELLPALVAHLPPPGAR